MAKKRGLRVIRQNRDTDCGVACLAMLTHHSYGDVSAMMRLHNVSCKVGMTIKEIIFVAGKLGTELAHRHKSKSFLNSTSGILGLVGGKMDPGGHWVVYKNGIIVCPTTGEVWSATDYFSTHRCRPTCLLQLA